ncbi:MAG: ATP-binding protein [Candidatus Omnitrophota bacterium]
MKSNFYFVSHLAAALLVLFFSFFVFIKNKKSKVNLSFSIFGSTIFSWLLFSSFAAISAEKEMNLFWFKMSYMGIILIPHTFLYFVSCVTEKKNTFIIFFSWLYAFSFILLLWFTNLFIVGIYEYPWGVYPRAFPISHLLFLSSFIILFVCAIRALISRVIEKANVTTEKLRATYILMGTLFGVCGSVDFLANYGINFYPSGFIFMILYPSILSYAILKYRLMDIRVALTRAGIFIAVYTFVLGIPLLIGFKTDKWLWAMLLMGVLSSVGPFVYSYLRQQIENAIFKEQQRYQQAIKELAKRMVQIRDMATLSKTIISDVFKVAQPEFIVLYIFSKDSKSYVLQDNSIKNNSTFETDISADSILVENLSRNKRPVILESGFSLDLPLETLIVPFFAESSLYGIMFIGPKPKKAVYIESDFIAFDILSSQASLAIENCLFWQEEKTRIAKEEQIKRMQAMDHFSAAMAHEIDNPITAIAGQLRLIELILSEKFKDLIPAQDLAELTTYAGTTVTNLGRISKMIKAVREFSRQDTGEFSLLSVEEAVDFTLAIVGPQVKYKKVSFTKEIEDNLSVRGNRIYLAEALMNLIVNSMHAVQDKPEWQGKIDLKVKKAGREKCLIEIRDNGYGIKKHLLENIFLDFVSTKASSEGTGMGLARVRKIIQMHSGKVWAQSEGAGKGATFFIELPLAEK